SVWPAGPGLRHREAAVSPSGLRDAARIAEIARQDRRHLAVALHLLQAAHDGAFEREIALPQAEDDRIARQLRRRPGDAPSFARGELFGEQVLRDAEIKA